MSFHIGCPIWSFKDWVGTFYPTGTKPADYLSEYTRRLTTVEGNTTFYAIPSQQTIASWAAETPQGFHFCPKLPRIISHEGALNKNIGEMLAFVDLMTGLGSRLGPMFLQLPPRFGPNLLGALETFLANWPIHQRLAVEVRHHGWFDASHHGILNQLLSKYNMARVVIDTRAIRDMRGDSSLRTSVYESLLEARERKPDVPVIPERTSDFVFIRYIGHPELDYNFPLLEGWTDYLVSEQRKGTNAYVFCHSPNNLIAPNLCRELYQLVAEQVLIPPLPWDEADATAYKQGRLF